MGRIGKIALTATALLAVGAGVLAYRTANFKVDGVAGPADIVFAATPAYDEALARQHLSQAIAFQTVSHQNPSDNDMSQWQALHSWIDSSYPAFSKAASKELVAGQTLVYTWQGSDPSLQPIILMAHQDVVPVTEGTEKDWKHAPFAGELADNAIWGRGSVDDKGSLIALLEASEALARSGFVPKRTIYVVSGHDEEAGGSGARAAAALLASRGVKALFTVDEGSVTVLDEPVTKGPVALIGIAEKGYGTIKVLAKAEGGHSSMPPKDTGVINLAKALVAINDDPFPLDLRGPGAQMLAVLAAKKGGATKFAMANLWLMGAKVREQAASSPAGAAMLHTTIAPTMLEGSPKENVLPQSASGLINYRIAPWNSSADVMARARRAVGPIPVTLSWVSPPREPSKVSSTQSDSWRLLSAAANADTPGIPVAPYLVVAGTDSRSFQDISTDVYRFLPIHVKLTEAKMIHGTNEHMTFDNLKRAIDFYARIITASAG